MWTRRGRSRKRARSLPAADFAGETVAAVAASATQRPSGIRPWSRLRVVGYVSALLVYSVASGQAASAAVLGIAGTTHSISEGRGGSLRWNSDSPRRKRGVVVEVAAAASASAPKQSQEAHLGQYLSRGVNAIRGSVQKSLRGSKGLFVDKEANRREVHKAKTLGLRPDYKLTFWGHMAAGAVSRSVAQTALHPANVLKTLLQTKGSFQAVLPLSVNDLMRGAGAQFLLSLPNGALHFAVLENTKASVAKAFPGSEKKMSALMDFAASCAATTICSITSTPQMVLTNRIMAGVYPNLAKGVRSVAREGGIKGFYAGWLPGLVQKIPSYGLTWVFYQQVKDVHYKVTKRLPTDQENFWLGSLAAAGSVTVMIPMDAVKTRLVTQVAGDPRQYKGIIDCFARMVKEEGVGSLYNSLMPRLLSVVPMIGLQYGTYEFMKRLLAEDGLEEGIIEAASVVDQQE